MEISTDAPLTGAAFAQHLEACLAVDAPVTLPGHGDYSVNLTPEQPGPPDIVYFQGTRVGPEGEPASRHALRYVIGSFSTTHAPLSIAIHAHTPDTN